MDKQELNKKINLHHYLTDDGKTINRDKCLIREKKGWQSHGSFSTIRRHNTQSMAQNRG